MVEGKRKESQNAEKFQQVILKAKSLLLIHPSKHTSGFKQGFIQPLSYSSLTTASFLTFQVFLSKSLNLLLPQFPICAGHGDHNSCLLHMSYRTQGAGLNLRINASPAEVIQS